MNRIWTWMLFFTLAAGIAIPANGEPLRCADYACKVTFNPNGGKGSMPARQLSYNPCREDNWYELPACSFTYAGHRFVRWEIGWSGKLLKPGEHVNLLDVLWDDWSGEYLSEFTLYACWEKTVPTYKVTFKANGGSGTMKPQTFKEGDNVRLKANAFSRSGYSFIGWKTDVRHSWVTYRDRDMLEAEGDIIVYAAWMRSETANGYTWMYELRSGGAWIVGVEGKPSGSVTVPATLGGKPVKFIGFPACSAPPVPYDALDLSNVTSITFPDTLKVIGGQLFKDSALRTFSLPASLKEVVFDAFENCAWWKNHADGQLIKDGWLLGYKGDWEGVDLKVSSKVTKIADQIFEGPALASLELPPGLKIIGVGVFWGQTELSNDVVVPESVTDVGDGAFYEMDTVYFLGKRPNFRGFDWGFGFEDERAGPYCDVAYFNAYGDTTGWVDGGGIGDYDEYEDRWRTMTYAWNGPGKLTVKPNSSSYGSVSGGGAYVEAGKLVLLKATAKDGYVFTGWFTDKDCTKKLNPEGYDNRKPTIKITMPAKATTIYAKFNSVATDKSGLKFSDSTKKLAKTAKAYAANAKISLALGFSSKSYPKVTASGLPEGLSIDAITGKITGSVKKPGAYTAKVTVTSAAGNKITQNVKIDVKAPSWATGTFSGYGAVIVKGKTVPVLATFTATAVGKVSGKVIYKGRSAPFTANYASATDTESRFTVSFSADGASFKSAMSIKEKMNGLTYTRAHALKADSFELELQKVVPLAQKGKSLAGMIGNSYTFKQGYEGSGLSKSGDKLVVKFCNKDVAKVSGIINGKKFTGLSVGLMACGKSKTSTTTKYKLNVPVVEPTTKYYRLLTFKVTIDTATKKVTKIEKSFTTIE